MDLFAFIRHSDPTKVWIGERKLVKREFGLLKMTKCCTVSLSLPATAAPEESGDSIEKLFDVADQDYAVEKSDDVLEVTIAKVASKVVAEKARKIRRESGKSLAALWGMVSNGFAIPSGATEPLIAASVAPISDARPLDFMFKPNLQTCPPHVRYVVSSDGSRHLGSYSKTNSFVRSLVADASVVMVNVTTTVDVDVGVGSKAKDVSKDFETNGIYEIDMHDLVPNVNSIYNVSTKRAKHNLEYTYLWHCRLAHISKKRIKKLQHKGFLKSKNDESFDQCVSCLSGKMTRKSFPHRPERVIALLGIIHTDVCGLLRHVSRQESATRILNMVPTKKVDKTPYELWYAEFFERNLITQEVSERAIGLEEPQDEDTSPFEICSKNPMEVLIDLPPGCKTVRSKWIFMKKTDMDGIIHTYKALLVAKGYTQLYGVDYEEMFSPVIEIKAIWILISIAACQQMSHGVTTVMVARMIVPLHIRIAGRQHTRQETRNLGLKAITDKSGPVLIRFEVDDRETFMPLGDHAARWANYLGELHLQKIYNGKKAALKQRYWVLEEDASYELEGIRRARPSYISEADWDA
nr:hypothetical protein [Tanacetum cinerariifolium]